eukprot:6171048-Amphidinium_carterae.1
MLESCYVLVRVVHNCSRSLQDYVRFDFDGNGILDMNEVAAYAAKKDPASHVRSGKCALLLLSERRKSCMPVPFRTQQKVWNKYKKRTIGRHRFALFSSIVCINRCS